MSGKDAASPGSVARPAIARRPHPARDQAESGFTAILRSLVARVPGARAAVLVDLEGETVDYAGDREPFDLRIAAAHFRIVLDEAAGQRAFGGLEWLHVRAARRSFVVRALPDRYALILELARPGGFAGWSRALDACERALGEEAGWGTPARRAGGRPFWIAVDVVCGAEGQPRFVVTRGEARPLEILGALVAGAPGAAREPGEASLTRGERGWRVRLENGAEATLVREPGGFWYLDEPVEPFWPGQAVRKSLAERAR